MNKNVCVCDWCVEETYPPHKLTKKEDGCWNSIRNRVKRAVKEAKKG